MIYLIFNNICDFAEKYPDKIEYREEIEVLMYRILIRPLDLEDEDSGDESKNPEDTKTNEKKVTNKKFKDINMKIGLSKVDV